MKYYLSPNCLSLAIPKKDIEARHEYMLSVIKDRIDNAEKYELE
jgi:hypothetical protein